MCVCACVAPAHARGRMFVVCVSGRAHVTYREMPPCDAAGGRGRHVYVYACMSDHGRYLAAYACMCEVQRHALGKDSGQHGKENGQHGKENG